MPRIFIITMFFVFTCVAWADLPISNASFESTSGITKHIPTAELAKNPKLLSVSMGNWSPVAWGTPEATLNALSTITVPDAPDGKRVAQVDNKANQISVFAYHIPQGLLTPGRWYEVTCWIRTQDLTGQGAFLMLEMWNGGYSCGGVDSEHLCGTNAWQKATVRFLAPSSNFTIKICLWVFGGPGKAWFDDIKLSEIPAPKADMSKRRVLDEPFWGMFTCFGNYMLQYGKDMKDAGVYWQRQGLGGLGLQELMKKNGMFYEMCFDGVPGPVNKEDKLWPISDTAAVKQFATDCAKQAGPQVLIFEAINEPNTNTSWTLPAYANLLNVLGKTVKAAKPGVLFGTGGFACPYIGYTEACLKRDPDKVIDIAMFHPYCVDEALDSQLNALTEACNRAGRPDIAMAINEIGFPSWDPATGHPVNEWFVSEADQASKVVKCHIQALAHKLSFVTYLGWNDLASEPTDQAKNMGLVRVDGSPKPSLGAYKFMLKTLGPKPRVVKQEYQDNGTRVYQFMGAEKKPVWVIWNALQDADATVNVGNLKVFPCDIYGVKQTVTPVSGMVKVKAGNFPIYLVCEK